jgi:hypothetical protein
MIVTLMIENIINKNIDTLIVLHSLNLIFSAKIIHI